MIERSFIPAGNVKERERMLSQKYQQNVEAIQIHLVEIQSICDDVISERRIDETIMEVL